MVNPIPIRRCFVVTVQALRELCESISTERQTWEVREGILLDIPQEIAINFNPQPASDFAREYKFPVVNKNTLFVAESGVYVCLIPIVEKIGKGKLYWENNTLKTDDLADWQQFWIPLEKAIRARFKEDRHRTKGVQ